MGRVVAEEEPVEFARPSPRSVADRMRAYDDREALLAGIALLVAGTAALHPPAGRARRSAGPVRRYGTGPRASPACYGKDTTWDGTVVSPEVGDPVSLMTWSYWPLPPSETTSRSCNFTPGFTGAWKPCCWRMVGSTSKKQ